MNIERYSFQQEACIETTEVSIRLGTYHFESELWERSTCVPDYYLTHIIDSDPVNAVPVPVNHPSGSRSANKGALTFMPPAFAPPFYNAPHMLRVAQCIIPESAFERFTGLPGQWADEPPRSFMDVNSRRIRDLFILLRRELTEPGFDSVIMTESLGRALMLEIGRHLRGLTPPRHAGTKLTSWQLKRITDMVHEKCGDGSTPSVSDLAGACGVSAGHLMRSFRMSTGSTLLEFIDGVRLEKAKALLIGSKLPLKCIATDAGFPNATRFSERFRILTGETPSEFRARNRGFDDRH